MVIGEDNVGDSIEIRWAERHTPENSLQNLTRTRVRCHMWLTNLGLCESYFKPTLRAYVDVII